MAARSNIFGLAVMLSVLVIHQSTAYAETNISLESSEQVKLINLVSTPVTYQGKNGVRYAHSSDSATENESLVMISGLDFHNGTIEVELAGTPNPDAGQSARGFVGVTFRLDEQDLSRYECFYLRPTNGRADDQLRRNHTAQYTSHPEYTWRRLREESPGMYESYTDIAPGEWTKVKIEVTGQSARLYVTNMDQPCLLVNDLKHGDSHGAIALWVHPTTVAHFRNLIITPE